MIWETSLLYYPDYRGKEFPYDEYLLDDDGKIGYYFEIFLSDGTHTKFPNTESEFHVTIPPNSSLYIEKFALHCSKDFKPGELRFQPYFQRKTNLSNYSYKKRYIENHNPVEKEYLNDLIFTKETRGTLLVQGELVDPRKTKRKAAKEDTVYYLISDDAEDYQLVDTTGSTSKNYVFGIRITNHWDVKFNNAYHNKLYMLNDDCDGFIWEKKHRPNDYIIFFAEWYASYYWHDKAMIVYPNDRYAIPTGLTGTGSSNRGAITKNFYVRSYWYGFYSIGGTWYTTKDGHDWVMCKETFRPDNSDHCHNWTTEDDKGIFVKDNYFYLGEVESSGQIHFTKLKPCGEISILGCGNGYIFFTKNRDTSEFKTIYGIDYNGTEYRTCLQTSEYTVSSFGKVNELNSISGRFVSEEIKHESYVGISTDGFKTVTIYSALSGSLPRYGDNFVTHGWYDGQSTHLYWSLRRQDAQNPSKYYCDIGNYGSAQPFKVEDWGAKNQRVDLAGASSADLSRAYYMDVDIVGKSMYFCFMTPDSPSLDSCLYFRDGKPSYPFGWWLGFWTAWNSVIVCIVVGPCNRQKDTVVYGTPPFTDTSGSFAFDLTSNYMIDPDNETWIYPY